MSERSEPTRKGPRLKEGNRKRKKKASDRVYALTKVAVRPFKLRCRAVKGPFEGNTEFVRKIRGGSPPPTLTTCMNKGRKTGKYFFKIDKRTAGNEVGKKWLEKARWESCFMVGLQTGGRVDRTQSHN